MIKLENICVSFKKEFQKKLFGKERQQVLVNVSFEVKKGECLGILGESGSGKTTLGRIICGLLKPDSGVRTIGGPIGIVFQDYTTSANPRFTVKQVISEALKVRERRDAIALDREKEVIELLELVGLGKDYGARYPHELSGGQLQRVCIARAVALRPEVIILDEPVSSLDAYIQVQIMDLLKEIRKKYDLTYVYITHDISSITYFCDRVLFLYHGESVETCNVSNIGNVKHSYSQNLLRSVVDIKEFCYD